jgi:[ribosomal protein S18]-alanine N-acetyltransferase
MNLTYSFEKMTEPQAREILSWRYEAPYDFYDPDEADFEDDLADMLEPANLYLAVSDENDALIGYYCFGREAQVAGGDYSEEVWDVGAGARPDLVGTGIGRSFIGMALNFAQAFFRAEKVRATVAAFNGRALKACEGAGFVRSQEFTRDDGVKFIVLLRDLPPLTIE